LHIRLIHGSGLRGADLEFARIDDFEQVNVLAATVEFGVEEGRAVVVELLAGVPVVPPTGLAVQRVESGVGQELGACWDDAFEYLVNKSSKGEKGQYFTPRWVIDMCVKMLNPQEEETLVDTACGSAGFPVHSIFHVWKAILKDEGLPQSNLFTMDEKPPRCIEYAREKVFGIDFDEKSVRVARCLNLIAGDGETNVLHLNTLDWKKWDETTKQEEWADTYHEGWKKLRKLQAAKGDYRNFQFDVLMANPPFAGDIKQTDMLAPYDLAHKLNKDGVQGKLESAVGRDLLFIERNLDFLRPGGRMAIVLPQGRFNNSSDQRVRQFIAERCRILAVVGLDPNTFKPHTGTKTSVLFVQKWNDDRKLGPLCKKVDDYNIFFATQRKQSKGERYLNPILYSVYIFGFGIVAVCAA